LKRRRLQQCAADHARKELPDAWAFAGHGCDAHAVQLEADPGHVRPACRVTDQLRHWNRGAPHPADEAPDVRNLANQVGALPTGAEAADGPELPLSACWFYIAPGATHGVEHAFQL
jgi:hypothetical protein